MYLSNTINVRIRNPLTDLVLTAGGPVEQPEVPVHAEAFQPTDPSSGQVWAPRVCPDAPEFFSLGYLHGGLDNDLVSQPNLDLARKVTVGVRPPEARWSFETVPGTSETRIMQGDPCVTLVPEGSSYKPVLQGWNGSPLQMWIIEPLATAPFAGEFAQSYVQWRVNTAGTFNGQTMTFGQLLQAMEGAVLAAMNTSAQVPGTILAKLRYWREYYDGQTSADAANGKVIVAGVKILASPQPDWHGADEDLDPTTEFGGEGAR